MQKADVSALFTVYTAGGLDLLRRKQGWKSAFCITIIHIVLLAYCTFLVFHMYNATSA